MDATYLEQAQPLPSILPVASKECRGSSSNNLKFPTVATPGIGKSRASTLPAIYTSALYRRFNPALNSFEAVTVADIGFLSKQATPSIGRTDPASCPVKHTPKAPT